MDRSAFRKASRTSELFFLRPSASSIIMSIQRDCKFWLADNIRNQITNILAEIAIETQKTVPSNNIVSSIMGRIKNYQDETVLAPNIKSLICNHLKKYVEEQ